MFSLLVVTPDAEGCRLCKLFVDPNFSVNSETGRAICHPQCGRGWDIISLHMELIGADFKTAKAEALPTGRASGGRVRTPKSERGGRVTGNRALPIRGARREPFATGLFATWSRTGRKRFDCRPDGRGGVVWNLDGVERIPYRLPQLLANKELIPVNIPLTLPGATTPSVYLGIQKGNRAGAEKTKERKVS